MDTELILSGVNAEHVSSLGIVAKIANDMKAIKEARLQLDEIVTQLHSKDVVEGRKFVHINFGSDIITINSASVQHHIEETYLFALISGRYDELLPKDKNGRVFLDLDVRWVEPQLNWLRDMAMWNGENITLPQISAVQPLSARGFELINKHLGAKHATKSRMKTTWLSSRSVILRDILASDDAMQSMLSSESDCLLKAKLLYRSSRDGYSAASFHKHCDGHKNTLCIIRDTDDGIFGAFTGDAAWKMCAYPLEYDYVYARNTFLFSLSKAGVFKPVKCKAKSDGFLRCSSVIDPRSLFGFGNGCKNTCSDLVVDIDSNRSVFWKGLGIVFESKNKSDFTDGKVAELEVFEIIFDESHMKSLPLSQTDVSSSDELPLEFSQLVQQRLDMNIQIHEKVLAVKRERQQLYDQAVCVLKELKFIAKFVGVTLPVVVQKDEKDSVSDMSELEKTLNDITTVAKLLYADRTKTNSDVYANDASSIVYINAGGRKIATTKATLLQAPSGSILANMASDVWGHDLDSEGNIFQDVNSDLFTAIINHLRLKALLPASEVPPITVYEEQTTAMDNLLAFYTLTGIPIEEITTSPPTVKRVRQ